MKVNEPRGITAVLLTVSKNFHGGRHSNIIYELVWFKVGVMIDTLHFGDSLGDPDLHSRSKECKKAKTPVPVTSQSSRSMWVKFGLNSREKTLLM